MCDLQGQLNRERELSHKLMATLTKLETQYHTEREAQFATPLSPSGGSKSPSDVFSGPGNSPVSC